MLLQLFRALGGRGRGREGEGRGGEGRGGGERGEGSGERGEGRGESGEGRGERGEGRGERGEGRGERGEGRGGEGRSAQTRDRLEQKGLPRMAEVQSNCCNSLYPHAFQFNKRGGKSNLWPLSGLCVEASAKRVNKTGPPA